MLGYLGRVIVVTIAVFAVLATAAFADDRPADQAIQEEVWAIPVTLPTIAYVVRPVGKGPFPLVVMNHGVSLNQRERGFFPLVEFRDAAMWFARRGYMVVAPSGSGYGAAALDDPERGLYSAVLFKDRQLRQSELPRCRACGGPDRQVDHRIHDRSKADRAGQRHCRRPIGRRLGGHRAVEREPPRGARHHRICGGARRTRRRQTQQQLRARQAGCGNRRIRANRSHAHAVDLHRERHVLRSGIIQANARGLHRRPEATPNITCFLRSAATDIFWSVRPTAFRCGRRWSGRSWTSTDEADAGRAMETKDDKAAAPPMTTARSSLVDSTAGPDAVGSRQWDCIRTTGREAGRRRGKRETGRPGVRIARPARGARHQVFGLAQVLLQGSRHKHGVPDIDQRYVRDRPVRCPHRPDRTRGRQGRAAATVPSRRPLPAGRGKDHDRPGCRLPDSLRLVPYQHLHRRRSGRSRA